MKCSFLPQPSSAQSNYRKIHFSFYPIRMFCQVFLIFGLTGALKMRRVFFSFYNWLNWVSIEETNRITPWKWSHKRSSPLRDEIEWIIIIVETRNHYFVCTESKKIISSRADMGEAQRSLNWMKKWYLVEWDYERLKFKIIRSRIRAVWHLVTKTGTDMVVCYHPVRVHVLFTMYLKIC